MNDLKINEFASIIIKYVRDEAIRNCDIQLRKEANSPVAKRWRDNGYDPSVIIPDCVDEVIFCLLNSIDSGGIRLEFLSESGESINLNEDGRGELSGLFMASGGWRAEYSVERFNDDFSDLIGGAS